MRRTLQASARSWSKHMPSWTRRTSACGSMLPAKGSVSGSRIQHRERWRAALPKPASWRYRHTRPRVRDAGQSKRSGRPGKGTEIVHRVATECLRHGAFCERCMRLSYESSGGGVLGIVRAGWAGRALWGWRGLGDESDDEVIMAMSLALRTTRCHTHRPAEGA